MSYNNLNNYCKFSRFSQFWAFVLYEETYPDNWRDIIDELHLKWIESPWHTDTRKKHKHILLIFDRTMDIFQVESITDISFLRNPHQCFDIRFFVRYMVHFDNPEMFQYDINDIIVHGCIDINQYFISKEGLK